MTDRVCPSGPRSSVKGSVTLDAASIASATTASTVVAVPSTTELANVQPGDVITCSPQAALDTGVALCYAFCATAGQITFVLANVTAGAIDPAAVVVDCVAQQR